MNAMNRMRVLHWQTSKSEPFWRDNGEMSDRIPEMENGGLCSNQDEERLTRLPGGGVSCE